MTNLGLFPAGGNTLGLSSALLWAGLGGNFVLGALMSLGIGLYAPCMMMVSLLGMNPRAAFPGGARRGKRRGLANDGGFPVELARL